MKRRIATSLLPLTVLALAFGAGCPAPTVDLDGIYQIEWLGGGMGIRIEIATTFPATTCTGVATGMFPSPHPEDFFYAEFSGTINSANLVSFTVNSSGGYVNGLWTCQAVDDDGDGVADSLQDCVIGESGYVLNDDPIPRIG